MLEIVYFSNYSGNTKKFVERLDSKYAATRIPIAWDSDKPLICDNRYVLFVPTYGGGVDNHAIPRSVREFLNFGINRKNLVGVVGFGNTNFGVHYCKAAEMISSKVGVPLIARVEIFGTNEDVLDVNRKMEALDE